MRYLLCVLTLVSLCSLQSGCSSTECNKKADCSRSQKCVKGKCEQNCTSDKECLNGEKCQRSTGNCYQVCTSDKECLNGTRCDTSTGNCIPVGDETSTLDGGGTSERPPTDAPPTSCGNGTIDSGEECEGTNFNNKTCADYGFAKGTLSCKGCQIDSTGCSEKTSKCGNQIVEPGEECEEGKLKGQECFTKGFTGGKLKCTNCKFDTSGCTGGSGGTKTFGQLCGLDSECKSGVCTKFNVTDAKGYCNAVCNPAQPCPSDAKCSFQVGSSKLCGWPCAPGGSCPPGLSCLPYAGKNFCGAGSGSAGGQCGNNKADAGEACDGSDLKGKSCKDFGYTGGTLQCASNCTPDTSLCTGGSKKKYGAPCQGATDCDAGLTCIKISASAANGFCTAPCTQGVPCPSTPPGATCILSTSNGTFCGWNCSSGASCPKNFTCITVGSGKACSPP